MARRQTDKPGKKKMRPPAFAAAGNIAIARFNSTRHLLPKCGATARSTGEPCRRVAMANGRCHYHGGLTPKGKEWHRRQWKQSETPNSIARFERKLSEAQKAARKRSARLAKMTADERATYDKWKRDHPTGTPAQREAKRLARKQNEDARARFLQPAPERPADAETAAIGCRIAELRAQLAALRDVAPDEQKPADDADPANPDSWSIFG